MRRNEQIFLIVILLLFGAAVIFAFLGIIAILDQAHGKSPVYKLDPKVALDHYRRFGDYHNMTENELRRAVLVETEPGHTEPLLSAEICALASWYNEKRFLYEILEDICNPTVKGPRK